MKKWGAELIALRRPAWEGNCGCGPCEPGQVGCSGLKGCVCLTYARPRGLWTLVAQSIGHVCAPFWLARLGSGWRTVCIWREESRDACGYPPGDTSATAVKNDLSPNVTSAQGEGLQQLFFECKIVRVHGFTSTHEQRPQTPAFIHKKVYILTCFNVSHFKGLSI